MKLQGEKVKMSMERPIGITSLEVKTYVCMQVIPQRPMEAIIATYSTYTPLPRVTVSSLIVTCYYLCRPKPWLLAEGWGRGPGENCGRLGGGGGKRRVTERKTMDGTK